jgi:hypothetical protein
MRHTLGFLAALTVLVAVMIQPVPAGARSMITVPAGTRVIARLDSKLSSDGNEDGDRFSATLVVDIAVNGAVAFRGGDKIYGMILEARNAGRVLRKAGFSCELRGIVRDGETVPIVTHPFDIDGERSGDVKKIAVKAVVGGAVGGGDMAKRMAASGSAIAVITKGKQIEMPQGIFVEFYLSAPVTVRPLTAPVQLDPASIALNYSKVVGDNAKSIMVYRWRSSMQLKKDEEVKSTKDMLVSFENGEPRIEPIGVEEKGKRGLRGKIQKRKQKKTKELIDEIGDLVRSYTMMSGGQSVDFLQKSTWSPAGGEMNRSIQFEAVDVLNPGDWVVVWIDMVTYQPRRLYLKAVLDEEAVQAEIFFRTLNDGSFYAAETRWVMPTKKLKGTIENTDHQRL